MSDSLIGPGPTSLRVSGGRRPRGVMRINGAPAAFLSFQVEQKGYFSASTWTAKMPAFNSPTNHDVFWWDAQGPVVKVELLMGFLDPQQPVNAAPDDPISLIAGQADNIDVDWIKGEITATGRDLTSPFIDNKTATLYPDQTGSQIATALAKARGLVPNVTETTTPSGQYYNNQYVTLTRGTPEWDLLKYLAQQEGFVCYVTGNSLYFGPPVPDTSPYVITADVDGAGQRVWSNAEKVRLGRSLTLGQDVNVTVLSSSMWSGTIKATATRLHSGETFKAAGPSESTQNYVFRRSGLTLEQAQKYADSMAEQITKHERLFSASAEGDVTMNPTRQVRVNGTDTSWDQLYFLDLVTHRFSMERGYGMTMRGKNHATGSDQIVP